MKLRWKWLFGETLRSRFIDRECLSMERLYQAYGANRCLSRECWEELWLEIAGILEVDPRRLRGTDRFSIELKSEDGIFGVDTSLESLGEWVEYKLSLHGVSTLANSQSIDRLDELISMIASCGALN